MPSRHLMLDLETLSTNRNSVILSIGAVIFNPIDKNFIDTFYCKVDIEEQTEKYNRHISEETLNWWSLQSPEVIMEAMGDENRLSYRDAVEKLRKFACGCDRVWSNGSVFDIIIIEDCMNDLEMPVPWQYYNIRDCRTIYELAGVSLKDKKYETKTTHSAIDDAIHQTIVLQDAYKILIDAGMTHLLG